MKQHKSLIYNVYFFRRLSVWFQKWKMSRVWCNWRKSVRCGPHLNEFSSNTILSRWKFLKNCKKCLKRYISVVLFEFKCLHKINFQDYFLPKGKIFCQFLLNVAQLFSYDVVKNEWSCIKQIDGTLFSGVPFDRDGSELAENYWKKIRKLHFSSEKLES